MPRYRMLELTPAAQAELVALRDHAPTPYLREKAAAVLTVAAGARPAHVARHGLLRPRAPATVYAWLDRYQAAGCAGLVIRPGCGRRPAFPPPDVEPTTFLAHLVGRDPHT